MEDLQSRLKNLYVERQKLLDKYKEYSKIKKENINIEIGVYEESLTPSIIEQAKRSAGVYDTL